MPVWTWILVAEDSENDEFLIRRALSEAGLSDRIVVANDGVEVLQCLLRQGRFANRPPGLPAVILMDERMPLMGGCEALRRIRANPSLRLIPVVMHSGAMSQSEVQEAYELGANGFVEKPADYQEFRRIFVELGLYWGRVNVAPVRPALAIA
jgi:two-component system response regulator